MPAGVVNPYIGLLGSLNSNLTVPLKSALSLTTQGAQYWEDDKNFGRQRLQGCNPNVIRLCTEIPSK